MSTMTVPNRPFSTDLITGLMLPDGFFETSLGVQGLNAHFTNAGSTALAGCTVYVESTSHPGIVVTPITHHIASLPSGASRVLWWSTDFSGASAGVHYVSFIAETPSARTRIIKKIFVTRVQFDASSTTFTAEAPEGKLAVRFHDLIIPADVMCCRRRRRRRRPDEDLPEPEKLLNEIGKLFKGHVEDFIFCPPGFLPHRIGAVLTPNPPYSGQYGDLPFEDPWWKVLLCIIAVILLIAGAIAAAVEGDTVVVTTGEGDSTPDGPESCCGVAAEGGSSSYVAAGLVAGAAAAAAAACASDERDPFRRGQDHTPPKAGETTVAEKIDMLFLYPEPIALGKPFAAGLKWEYTRVTSGETYTYSAEDANVNVHTLSNCTITAPDVIHHYASEPFIIKAEFYDKDGTRFRGDDLLVQCFLVGPGGQYRKFLLQDDGIDPDEKPSDGIYTGMYHFENERHPKGLWTYYVIAQDVNNAQPDMSPEEAAKIIGGIVLTQQLVITFDEEECPFIPDGHVQVL